MSEVKIIPPVIVALDTETTRQADGLIRRLKPLPRASVGLKIARWHDQRVPLRKACADTGRFVVLDTQLNDVPVKMQKATRYLLNLTNKNRRPLLPDAITIHPFKEILRGERGFIRDEITDFARAAGVLVIGHSEQTRWSPDEQVLHEDEVSKYHTESNGSGFGLDIMELHADTVLSLDFPGVVPEAPKLIASRFSAGYEGKDEEGYIIDRAGQAFAKGIDSIYLGDAVIKSLDPIGFIEKVLDARAEAGSG